MLAEYGLGFVKRGAEGSGNQILRCHRLAQRTVEIPLELQIAVGDYPDELAVAVHDRHTRYLEPPHQGDRFA